MKKEKKKNLNGSFVHENTVAYLNHNIMHLYITESRTILCNHHIKMSLLECEAAGKRGAVVAMHVFIHL